VYTRFSKHVAAV